MEEKSSQIDILLPHNILAEELILGSMCLDKENIPLILKKLPLETFYKSEHRILYKALIDLHEKNGDFTFLQIINYLDQKEVLDSIGGVEFLIQIINKVVTTINLDKYIFLIQEKYFRRLLILLGKYIIEAAYDQKKDLEELIVDIESRIYTITDKRLNNSMRTTTELVSSILLNIHWKFTNSKTYLGLLTSYYNLDTLTQGFQNSELIIIAGRPSMGKTAFSLNIVKNIVENYKIAVLIFSLEMSKQQLIYRFLSIITGLNLIKIRSGNLTVNEWNSFQLAILNIAYQPIYIDDDSSINLLEIQAKSRKMLQKKSKLGLIIIDYLQLMQMTNQNNNRAQELSYITRSLKILAKELNIPIIVLSQLSRNVESRIDKRPILSDLRDSGCFASKTFFQEQINKINSLKTINACSSSNSIIKTTLFTGQKPIYGITKNSFLSKFFNSSLHKFFTNKGWENSQGFSYNIKTPIFCSYFNKPLFWISNQNFTYKKLNSVYDIEIENNPIYIFNNQIFHNSIEQDADIVLMLYREDYYNHNQVTNLTELILAKQRNGPIGLIKLVFDKNSLQFKNINTKEAAVS